MELQQILEETMESFNNYLVNIPNGCSYITDKIYKEEYDVAFKAIKDFSDGMVWLVEASALLKQNNIEVDFDVEKIVEFLQEINSGLESQDYVLVSDMFEYEIKPYFEEVKGVKNN